MKLQYINQIIWRFYKTAYKSIFLYNFDVHFSFKVN